MWKYYHFIYNNTTVCREFEATQNNALPFYIKTNNHVKCVTCLQVNNLKKLIKHKLQDAHTLKSSFWCNIVNLHLKVLVFEMSEAQSISLKYCYCLFSELISCLCYNAAASDMLRTTDLINTSKQYIRRTYCYITDYDPWQLGLLTSSCPFPNLKLSWGKLNNKFCLGQRQQLKYINVQNILYVTLISTFRFPAKFVGLPLSWL